MTQKEFEQLTGASVTPEQYADIEKIYMATDADKVQFCKEWVENKYEDSHIVWDLYRKQSIFKAEVQRQKQQLDSLAVFLIEQAHKYSSVECRDKAISMVGKKDYLAYKLEHEMNLWEDERVMIIEILKQK